MSVIDWKSNSSGEDAAGRAMSDRRGRDTAARRPVDARTSPSTSAAPLFAVGGVGVGQSSSLVIAMFEPWSSPDTIEPVRWKVE